MFLLIASAFTLAAGFQPAQGQMTGLTAQADSACYSQGDTINVSGHLNATTIDQPLVIQVADPRGNMIRIDQIEAGTDGSYQYSFTGGGLMSSDGTYTITVIYKGTARAETTFIFVPGNTASGWRNIFILTVGENGHPIEYFISGCDNRLLHIIADPERTSLLAHLSTQSNGTFSLRLDPEIFDKDDEFVAFVNGVQVPVDDTSSGTKNVMVVSFEAGTQQIEIIGNYLIPEFGAVAGSAMAISAAMGIILIRQFSNKN